MIMIYVNLVITFVI